MTCVRQLLAPPPAGTYVAISFVDRLDFTVSRTSPAGMARLLVADGFPAELERLGIAASAEQLGDYATILDLLAGLSGAVHIVATKAGVEQALAAHRGGRIVLARTDLALCAVPRDWREDQCIPGARQRIESARSAAIKRGHATQSEVVEWHPLGDWLSLHVPDEQHETRPARSATAASV